MLDGSSKRWNSKYPARKFQGSENLYGRPDDLISRGLIHHESWQVRRTGVSKLSISCLAKRYRLVCRNIESRERRRRRARLRDSIVAELQIGGIMGIVCCWISIQPASRQRQRCTNHFFRSRDSTLPPFLRFLSLASAYWIHLRRREFRRKLGERTPPSGPWSETRRYINDRSPDHTFLRTLKLIYGVGKVGVYSTIDVWREYFSVSSAEGSDVDEIVISHFVAINAHIWIILPLSGRHESYSDSVQSRVIYCKTCGDACRVRTHETKHVVRAYVHPGSGSPYAPLLHGGIATKCDFVSSDQMQSSDFNATPPALGRTKVGFSLSIVRYRDNGAK